MPLTIFTVLALCLAMTAPGLAALLLSRDALAGGDGRPCDASQS